mmetsp:Transcript_89597/g.252566  ORF Transcript_89597/g.252566 Transcript_89597/m.252566 type:complete len:426 (+) Transcript_89597:82-1359(+)
MAVVAEMEDAAMAIDVLPQMAQEIREEMMIAMLSMVQGAATVCAEVCVQRLAALRDELQREARQGAGPQLVAWTPEQPPQANNTLSPQKPSGAESSEHSSVGLSEAATHDHPGRPFSDDDTGSEEDSCAFNDSDDEAKARLHRWALSKIMSHRTMDTLAAAQVAEPVEERTSLARGTAAASVEPSMAPASNPAALAASPSTESPKEAATVATAAAAVEPAVGSAATLGNATTTPAAIAAALPSDRARHPLHAASEAPTKPAGTAASTRPRPSLPMAEGATSIPSASRAADGRASAPAVLLAAALAAQAPETVGAQRSEVSSGAYFNMCSEDSSEEEDNADQGSDHDLDFEGDPSTLQRIYSGLSLGDGYSSFGAAASAALAAAWGEAEDALIALTESRGDADACADGSPTNRVIPNMKLEDFIEI